MFIPVKISPVADLDLRLSIPTGFDYELNWIPSSGGVVFLDNKKIMLPIEDDSSILNIAYMNCAKYFLKPGGMEVKIKSYDLKYPEHIAAAILIKGGIRKNIFRKCI
jgi:hypothetical protein